MTSAIRAECSRMEEEEGMVEPRKKNLTSRNKKELNVNDCTVRRRNGSLAVFCIFDNAEPDNVGSVS